jgi:hypothetical protein
VIGLTGLLRIELPGHTVRLCDGAFFDFGGERYRARDSVLGVLSAVGDMTEGTGTEIPALDLTFNPPGPVAIGALSAAALARGSVKFWLAEYDIETGLISGTPELRFLGFVDQPAIRSMGEEYTVSIVAVPELEYMFDRDTGNTLSPSFHKAIFPGETGHDNATGLSVPVAWGVEAPPAQVSYVGTSGRIPGWSGRL